MQPLNRNAMEINGAYPERILQFGGGNFLRGFVDWIIDIHNERTNADLGVLVVKPTPNGDYAAWRRQDGLYQVLTKGVAQGELVQDCRMIRSITRIIHPYQEWEQFLESATNPALNYIISNTTELGIRFGEQDRPEDNPPAEFPAKLLRWLMARYVHFDGALTAGCVIIPTELLVDNGALLRKILNQYVAAWQLDAAFGEWLNTANTFCNTLVDRIVPGIKGDERQEAWQQTGYADAMITQGEPYHFWAIEAPPAVRRELPLDQSGLEIVFCDDITPYRVRKVRILNGAHIAMVPVGYLYGLETVREAVENEQVGEYIRQLIFREILPTLTLPERELRAYADAVIDRFRNPFIRHELISIALNAIAKIKARILPSLLDFHARRNALPQHMVFAMAAMCCFYRGVFPGGTIPLKDAPATVDQFRKAWSTYVTDGAADYHGLAEDILGWEEHWGEDLNRLPGLADLLSEQIKVISEEGMSAALRQIVH